MVTYMHRMHTRNLVTAWKPFDQSHQNRSPFSTTQPHMQPFAAYTQLTHARCLVFLLAELKHNACLVVTVLTIWWLVA
jgi:hypothetical protein